MTDTPNEPGPPDPEPGTPGDEATGPAEGPVEPDAAVSPEGVTPTGGEVAGAGDASADAESAVAAGAAATAADRRPWIVGGVIAAVLLSVIGWAVWSGGAEAAEPSFSWIRFVRVEIPATSTTTSTIAPTSTSTSTTSTTPSTTTTAPTTTTSQASTTTTSQASTTTTTAAPTTTTTEAPTTTTAPSTTTTQAPTTTTTEAPTTTTAATTTTTTAPSTTTTQAPTTTTTEVPSSTLLPPPPEAPADIQTLVATFVTEFNTALDTDDVDWLYDHLAPAVIEVYGEDACRSHLEDAIAAVSGLTLRAPVLGPMGRQVEVPRPGGDPVVLDLTALYSAEIAFTHDEEPVESTGWLQIPDPAAEPVAYFVECAPAR